MTPNDFQNSLGAFADPATPIEVHEAAQKIRVTLTRNGNQNEYILDKLTARITVPGSPQQSFATIGSLIASPDFADLRGMAATQHRLLADVLDAPFLDPYISIENADIGNAEGETALIKTLDSPVRRATKIILLDGPAGVGKTRLLERITAQRAAAYCRGVGRPMLYVGSRGRRLSNLPDTLAGATQTIRTRFTYEQVPFLVSSGLMDLAIDGFDELVDADGYQDAWHALRDFIKQLNGSGTCILAGRDTFFDQQGFLNRLRTAGGTVDLVQAHLNPVSVSRAKAWLASQGWNPQSLDAPEAKDLLQPGSYTLRPYFLSQLAEATEWEDLASAGSARAFLISQFLRREATLFSLSVSVSPEDAQRGIADMLQAVALDMAERESTEVDTEYLSLLCEVYFEQILEPHDLKKLQHKAGSTGLLEKTSSDRLRRFPHSEVQYHFLAHGLLDELAHGKMPIVLRRGVLGSDFMEMLLEVAESLECAKVASALTHLLYSLRREESADRLSNNANAMLFALLALSNEDLPSSISNAQISECVASGTLRPATISQCTIARMNAQGADLSSVIFDHCRILVLSVDSLTTFGSATPAIDALEVNGLITREPSAIRNWLDNHDGQLRGLGNPLPLRYPFEEFFDRVCRRAIRQFYLREGTDDPASELLRHEWWPHVVDILDSESRLQRITKPMGGVPTPVFHIRQPRSLLEPGSNDVTASGIRRRVREVASKLG